jgi:hypothetical protein
MNTRIIRYAAALVFVAPAYAVEPDRVFQRQEYPASLFEVSEQAIDRGTARIHIIQARRSRDNKDAPHFCRAWLSVSTADKVLFSRYFGDIDPSGYSFGLFVPEVQPGKRFVAVVKVGDYDGRLYLVRDDGKTTDLDGGRYFITEDGRFLLSEYASDEQRLTMFDFEQERVVFSMKEGPDIVQWYQKDRQLFFTERLGNDWPPRERLDVVKRYDFASHRLVEERTTPDLMSSARKVAWSFDPRTHRDCQSPAKRSSIRSRSPGRTAR